MWRRHSDGMLRLAQWSWVWLVLGWVNIHWNTGKYRQTLTEKPSVWLLDWCTNTTWKVNKRLPPLSTTAFVCTSPIASLTPCFWWVAMEMSEQMCDLCGHCPSLHRTWKRCLLSVSFCKWSVFRSSDPSLLCELCHMYDACIYKL